MIILSYFEDGGVPALGLTPAITIYDLSDDSVVIAADAMSEVATGIYKYDFVAYDPAEDYGMYVDGGVALDDIDRYQAGSNSTDNSASVWDFTPRTLTSFGTLVADVWNYARRTLTMSIGAILSSISGNEIQLDAGDYIEYNVTDLGSLVGRTKLWWTLKASKGDTDVQSLAKIEETIGLEYIAGVAAGTPANGSITVTDAVVGNITIVLAGAESVKLIENEGKAYFDIKWINAAGQELTLRRARALIVSDITRETA